MAKESSSSCRARLVLLLYMNNVIILINSLLNKCSDCRDPSECRLVHVSCQILQIPVQSEGVNSSTIYVMTENQGETTVYLLS